MIDFHTHVFPDGIVAGAISALEEKSGVKAALDGTIADLRRSMHKNGISHSVVCSIATSPKQFAPILEWSKGLMADDITPLPSVHPASPTALNEIQTIHDEGFKGVKLHPYYQDFFLDEKRLLPLFNHIATLGLFVVIHAGYDIGFKEEERANPSQIKNLLQAVPTLKLVAAHLGAWKQWDEVARELIGQDVYLDLAFVLDFLDHGQAITMLKKHPQDRILWGSDSPWEDQATALATLRSLRLGDALEEQILETNGRKLLSPITP